MRVSVRISGIQLSTFALRDSFPHSALPGASGVMQWYGTRVSTSGQRAYSLATVAIHWSYSADLHMKQGRSAISLQAEHLSVRLSSAAWCALFAPPRPRLVPLHSWHTMKCLPLHSLQAFSIAARDDWTTCRKEREGAMPS